MRTICVIGLLAMCSSRACRPQSKQEIKTLCDLQSSIDQGEHVNVLVSGTYVSGYENSSLHDPACPNGDTWVDFALQSKQNDKELDNILGRSQGLGGQAYVIFEGEFYGPPVPDPKLPEAIRKSYHPGWGHLAGFRTQLVVHVIRDVRALPTTKP
jgi:hypothetical protein